MSCLFNELLLFDIDRPAPDIKTILLSTIFIVLITNISYRFIMDKVPSEQMIETLDKDKNKEYKAIQTKGIHVWEVALYELLNGTLYAPIAEELFFRFFLFKSLFVKKLDMNPVIANVLQAIIFGSLHMSNSIYSSQETSNSIIQSISSAIIGLVCGYVYYTTNSIIPAILAHTLNNLRSSLYTINEYKNFIKFGNI